jgi:hypothetical protein
MSQKNFLKLPIFGDVCYLSRKVLVPPESLQPRRISSHLMPAQITTSVDSKNWRTKNLDAQET